MNSNFVDNLPIEIIDAAVADIEKSSQSEISYNMPSDVFASFGFYTLAELSEEEKQPPEFIIHGMVPVGLTFLSGAPKTRKSYLALQAASCVARGAEFLGHKTKQCDVVYFDLEGSKSRISARSEQMGNYVPDNLFIANKLERKLSNGLIDYIEALVKQRPSIRLIVIDTYSHARGLYKSKGANAYDADVALLEPLQQMAINENIAVVCIHHFKKGASNVADSFEQLSGTMGISGSADSVLNLVTIGKRFEGRATLEVTPRDAKGFEAELFFDDMTGRWRDITDDARNPVSNPICNWILQNMPKSGAAGTFYAYATIAEETFRRPTDGASEIIRDACLRYKRILFEDYNCFVQVGVRSGGLRGIRITCG